VHLENLDVRKLLRDGDRLSRRVPRKAPRDGRLVVVRLADKALVKPSMAAAKEAGMRCFSYSAPTGSILFASTDEDRLDDVLSEILSRCEEEPVAK
jgi:hypothetical protein